MALLSKSAKTLLLGNPTHNFYIGNDQVVQAKPASFFEVYPHKEGKTRPNMNNDKYTNQPGYAIQMPDKKVTWAAQGFFKAVYRRMTDAEVRMFKGE